jgi:hypothetical protein
MYTWYYTIETEKEQQAQNIKNSDLFCPTTHAVTPFYQKWIIMSRRNSYSDRLDWAKPGGCIYPPGHLAC